MKGVYVFIMSAMFVIALFFIYRKSKYVCKKGKCYTVDSSKSKESHEMLYSIEKDMKSILMKLSKDLGCPRSIKNRIPYCLNNSTLSENIYKLMGTTSFTVDKRDIYLCIKDENDKFYDKNLVIMVAIHEYSHVLCNSQNHTPEFYSINKYILKKAVEWGYHKPINFKENPVNYCGMKLETNPI